MFKRYTTTLAVLTLALAACSDGTGPGAQAFDADATSAELLALDSAFGTQAFLSLAALGGQFNAPGTPVAPASVELLQAAARPAVPGVSYRLDAAARRVHQVLRASAAVELIPQQYRGLVFVYVPGEGYVVDEGQTGPANGMRFTLYAVNPVTGAIVEPLNAIGHVDLRDESTDNTASIRLIVESESVTYVNYAVTAAGPPTAPSFTIAGFITNGTVTADFSLVHALQSNIGGVTVSIDYSIDVAERDFGIDVDVTLASSGEQNTATIAIVVSHQGNTVRIAGDLSNGSGSLQVFGNGELFATITITPSSVEAVNAAGQPLSAREREVLEHLFEFVDDVFDVFEDLFDPVGFLFSQ